MHKAWLPTESDLLDFALTTMGDWVNWICYGWSGPGFFYRADLTLNWTSLCALTYLFNISFERGIFPSAWKNANVILLHKGGPESDTNNYRPISLFPLPQKILESIVHSRIYAHLQANDILTFRPNHSTQDASLNLLKQSLGVNGNMRVGVLFIDLQKSV